MNAQQLKNAILQDAITGRLVPQDPNDEPASVLLDKIRKEKAKLVKEGKLKKKDLEEKPISKEEIPFEIPESWEWVRLKNLVSLITKGSSPSWQGIKYVDEGVLFITSENVREGFLDLSSPKFLEESFNELQRRSILKKGDLLTNIVGASIGRTAEFDLDTDNCNINQAVAIIRLIDYSIKTLLLKIFNSSFIINQMIGKTVETARPNISLSSIENLLIPLPPLSEQHRIVAKIEELLPKVEEYGKAQEALDKLNAELPERLKKSILQEAITGKLVPQDPNDEPASVLLDKIRKEKAKLVKEGKLKKKDLIETPISKEEIPFEIPESWEWCSLGNVVSLLSGRDLTPQDYNDSKDGIPYITGASNFDGSSLIINRWTPKPITISKYGDLLITCKGTIGTMTFNTIGNIHIARQVMAISPYVIDIKYIKYFLVRKVYELEKKAKSIIPGISREDILTALIPLPPLAEQHRIVAKIEELLSKIDRLKTK